MGFLLSCSIPVVSREALTRSSRLAGHSYYDPCSGTKRSCERKNTQVWTDVRVFRRIPDESGETRWNCSSRRRHPRGENGATVALHIRLERKPKRKLRKAPERPRNRFLPCERLQDPAPSR